MAGKSCIKRSNGYPLIYQKRPSANGLLFFTNETGSLSKPVSLSRDAGTSGPFFQTVMTTQSISEISSPPPGCHLSTTIGSYLPGCFMINQRSRSCQIRKAARRQPFHEFVIRLIARVLNQIWIFVHIVFRKREYTHVAAVRNCVHDTVCRQVKV